MTLLAVLLSIRRLAALAGVEDVMLASRQLQQVRLLRLVIGSSWKILEDLGRSWKILEDLGSLVPGFGIAQQLSATAIVSKKHLDSMTGLIWPRQTKASKASASKALRRLTHPFG